MSAKLHLAKPSDIDKLQSLVARFHTGMGIERTEEQQRDALLPLLEGSPHGVAYLIGPRTSPVGYIVISFGYSIELGGIDGFIDEFFIREKLRGRGLGGEVLRTLLPALAENGVMALHLEVDSTDDSAQRLYGRLGFKHRERYQLMSRTF
ncbi:MAG: GNAT family N-acetyltransferase [Pseudoruegeria sp.]